MSYEYTLFGNEYFVEIMIRHLRNTSVSLEEWIYIIRKENKLLEGSQTAQKDDLSIRVTTRNMVLNEVPHFQSVFYMIQGSSPKSNVMWQDQKKYWQVWKVGEPLNDYFFFLFCVIYKS